MAPVPGWTPGEHPDATGDPARREIGELVREVLATYRARASPVLALSLVIEGGVSLLSLPYLVVSFGIVGDVVGQVLANVTSGRITWTLDESTQFAEAFRRLSDPGLAALGGAVSVLPLASVVLLSGTVTALILSPDPAARSIAGALRAVGRRWTAILVPIAALAAGAALVGVWTAQVSAGLVASAGGRADAARFGLGLLLAAMSPALLVGAAYLAVRWAVAVPAIVLEGVGLGAGLARSARLTSGRMLHVGVALLVALAITSIGGWLLAVPTLVLAVLGLVAGGGPLVAVAVALYVGGRIVVAPVLAIVTAVLYRDLRDAGERRSTGFR